MSTPVVLSSGLTGGVGLHLDDAGTTVVFAQFGGSIATLDVATSTVTTLGTGYTELEDAVLSGDASRVYAVERGGDLLVAPVLGADRAAATVISCGLRCPQQLVLFEDAGVIWVVEYADPGRLVEVSLTDGAQRVLSSGLRFAVGLVASSDRTRAYVSEQDPGAHRLSVVEVGTGAVSSVLTGLTSPFFLSWYRTDTELLLTERDPVNRISLVDVGVAGAAERTLVAASAGFRPSAAVVAANTLYVTTDTELLGYDVTTGWPSAVTFRLPTSSVYICSYLDVEVDLSASGYGFEQLDFDVAEGRAAGSVSRSRPSFEAAATTITLLAGYEVGPARLRAVDPATAMVVGEHVYQITDEWRHRHGPSRWVDGVVARQLSNPTWGGGPSTTLQNYQTIPALGTRKVAVLFADTADQRYPTGASFAAIVDRWRKNAFDGVTDTDGVVRSTKAYYHEVSYGLLTLAGTVFTQPVHLSGHWDAYFDGGNLEHGKGELFTQVVNAASATGGLNLDLTDFDMIVVVSEPWVRPAPDPARVAWPYGGYTVGVDTPHGRVTSYGVSMPHSWGNGDVALDQGGGRSVYETLSHELGHTLQLPDEYSPVVVGRNLGETVVADEVSWDPMDWEFPLPHLCLPHRMMLGWIDASWVKRYDFQATGTLVDEVVHLSPIENGAPSTGRFAGVEVRIGDGHNYYFEYRRRVPGDVGDANVTPNARVVGIEVKAADSSRPDMLLLEKHADDDGAVLAVGNHYHEVDSSTPTFPTDFRVDVQAINANEARIRVRYQVIGKPDPSIRPWPRDADHQWQSPDITVFNARSATHPEWANEPWLGHPNTVLASVTNRGTVSAPGVVCQFFAKDYTVGGAPENHIGTDTHDVAPGATVLFQAPWTPDAPAPDAPAPHQCIIARIDPYATPTSPSVRELTSADNEAQSNYALFISASASPPSREIVHVAAGNPHDRAARFFLSGGQDNPFFRTYFEHTWVWLEPGEVRPIAVGFEFAPDVLTTQPKYRQMERMYDQPNQVDVVGWLENPNDPFLHAPVKMSGVTARIVHGSKVWFDRFARDGELVLGHLVAANGSVPRGDVLILSEPGPKETSTQTQVQNDGSFRAVIHQDVERVQAYFVPESGYGDGYSKVVER